MFFIYLHPEDKRILEEHYRQDESSHQWTFTEPNVRTLEIDDNG